MSAERFDLTSLGEAMLRLSVPAGQRLETTGRLDVFPAGSEANVCAALARLGRRCSWIGGLPDNALARLIANHLRMAGVDVSRVRWCSGGRVGTYFVEFATAPRPTRVIYDRAGSSAALLQPEEVDWDHLLHTGLLHLTGITPAISTRGRAVAEESILRARAAGVPLSVDVNYRSALWSPEDAERVLSPMVEGADLLFCAREDAGRLFHCTGTHEEVVRGLALRTGARAVVVTLGADGVMALAGERLLHEPAVPVEVVDPIGAGDALAAGVIHGWLQGDLALGLRCGVILAALNLTQHGDMTVTTPEELAALLADTGGGVLR